MCVAHKSECVLEDGTPLHLALRQAAPEAAVSNSAIGGEEAAIHHSSGEVIDLADPAEETFNRALVAAKRRAVLGHWPASFAELRDFSDMTREDS